MTGTLMGIRGQPRSRAWSAVAIIAAIALSGCGILPSDPPTVSADAAQRALQLATGIPLQPSVPSAASVSFPNLIASLSGSRDGDSVVVLIFDSSAATAQVLGPATSPQVGEPVATRRANVVVLSIGGPDLVARVRRGVAAMDLHG